MAIFHCSIKIVSRSSGRSASGAAAYRSAGIIKDMDTGLVHDYSRKRDVVFSEILLPDHAPREFMDRQTLWQSVQAVEKRKDAQLAREVEVGLPVEFTKEQQIECVRNYIVENFVCKGMIADWSLHEKKGNPHAHIMLTMREIDETGKWVAKQKTTFALDENGERIPVIDPKTGKQKIRIREGRGEEKMWVRVTIPSNDWNDQGNAEKWRAAWAECCNRYLQNEKIDHRSYKRQGIDKEPTIHEGHVAHEMGERSERHQLNMEIKKRNALLDTIKKLVAEIRELIQNSIRKEEAPEVKTQNHVLGEPASSNSLKENMLIAERKEVAERLQKLKNRREYDAAKENLKMEEEDIYGRLRKLREARAGAQPDEGADGRKREDSGREPGAAAEPVRGEEQLVEERGADRKTERDIFGAGKETLGAGSEATRERKQNQRIERAVGEPEGLRRDQERAQKAPDMENTARKRKRRSLHL